MSEWSVLWVIIFFVFWCTPYDLCFYPISRAGSEGYSLMWSIIWLLWAIIICPVIDQGGVWANRESHEWSYSLWLTPWCTPIVYLFALWYLMTWEGSSFFVVIAHIWLLWALTKATMSDQNIFWAITWATARYLGSTPYNTIMQFTLYHRQLMSLAIVWCLMAKIGSQWALTNLLWALTTCQVPITPSKIFKRHITYTTKCLF